METEAVKAKVEEEAIDFNGVQFVLVDALELAKVHQQLRSARRRINHLERRVGFFCGMDEDQVKTMRGDYQRLQENLATTQRRVGNLEWEVKVKNDAIAQKQKDIDALKVKLYDKVNP